MTEFRIDVAEPVLRVCLRDAAPAGAPAGRRWVARRAARLPQPAERSPQGADHAHAQLVIELGTAKADSRS
jgi:hypothetical protein